MLTRRRWLAGVAAMAAMPERAWPRRTGSGLPYPLFDAHAHLKSDDLVRYPHAPPGPPPPGPPQPEPSGETPEVVRVLRWMDQNGVGNAAAVQHRATYGNDNRYLLDSTDQYRARLVPIVALAAEDAQTPELLRQMWRQHGVAGLRLTGSRAADGSFPWLESTAAQHTWTAVETQGLVMDLMALPATFSAPALAAYGRLARQYPGARLVLDNCAWPEPDGPPEFGLGAEHRALLANRNVFFKLTTANLNRWRAAGVAPAEAVRHMVAVLGADRIMWGSDIGQLPGLYGEMVARIVAATARLARHERRALLHDTAARVMVAGGSR
jgi:predicted TIM-barrel fold metal-dependent hydrolase